MLNIEENMSNEQNIMSRWHTYSEMGGSADFETFYSHGVDNQKLLVKVARGKQKLINPLAMSKSEEKQC